MRGLVIILICTAYVLSPIDIIPDWFIGPGQLDDLGVIFACGRMLLKGGKKSSGKQAAASSRESEAS